MRIYVGGLGESVTSDDLKKIFSAMGSVEGVDIVRTKGRSFAYIDFAPSSSNSLPKLFSSYNGCVWKGGRLRLEKAKEDYLTRLRREWDEQAAEANTTPGNRAEAEKSICLPEEPKKDLETAKKQLKVFFPRLGKLKSVPFKGTGKHKYSFQRVEVPPMPTYFCDCEEHFASHTTQGTHIDNWESQDPGINAEELNIMNAVMNRLFQRESGLKVTNAEVGHANEEGENEKLASITQHEENEADDDNLIINVVSSGNSRLTSSKSQKQETVPRKRKSILSEENEPRDGYLMDATKEGKDNTVHQSKKKKLVGNEKSRRKEVVPAEPENRDPSKADLGSQSGRSAPESGIECSRGSILWSQKSSWKALIADGESTGFSMTNFLSGSASSKEQQPQPEDPDIPDSTNINSQKLTRQTKFRNKSGHKQVLSENADDLLININAAGSESGGLASSDAPGKGIAQQTKSSLPKNARKSIITKSGGGDEYSAADSLDGEGRLIDSNKPEKDAVVSELSPCTTTNEDQSKPNNPSFAKPIYSDSQTLDGEKHVEDKTAKGEVGDGYTEAEPIKVERSVNNSGRGSSWLHKSSWTQITGGDNGAFSITQLLPGLTFEKPDLDGSSNMDVENRTSAGSVQVGKPSEPKSCEDHFQAMETIVPQNSLEKGKQTVVCSSEASPQAVIKKCNSEINKASPAAVVEEHNLETNKGCGQKIEVGDTCSFMRSAASLKEWAKAKKALSEPRKRENAETQVQR